MKGFTTTIFVWLALILLLFSSCQKADEQAHVNSAIIDTFPVSVLVKPAIDSVLLYIPVTDTVRIKDYFSFLDTLVLHYDTLTAYPLNEHVLVRANPWLIDSLVASDYYTKMEEGIFICDQTKWPILLPGDSLAIPNQILAQRIIQQQKSTIIDINVPEFKLRIIEEDQIKYTFPVRVGKASSRYMATAGRVVDMKTHTGEGCIVKIVKDPFYINPVNSHIYSTTSRDDGRRTKLPQIPFLHPEIDGHRWGQLIHPTTNPVTLGRAYSNGCIGTGEGDAWRIYYYAPLNTRVRIRYNLKVINSQGDTILLKDIYS